MRTSTSNHGPLIRRVYLIAPQVVNSLPWPHGPAVAQPWPFDHGPPALLRKGQGRDKGGAGNSERICKCIIASLDYEKDKPLFGL